MVILELVTVVRVLPCPVLVAGSDGALVVVRPVLVVCTDVPLVVLGPVLVCTEGALVMVRQEVGGTTD